MLCFGAIINSFNDMHKQNPVDIMEITFAVNKLFSNEKAGP